MSLTFTFRRKITLAITLAALGTLILCATALMALTSVLDSSRQVSALREVSSALMEVEIELYALTKQRAGLRSPEIPAFEAQSAEIRSNHIQNLTTALRTVDIPVQQRAAEVIPEVTRHLDSLDNWLGLKIAFGLSASEGLLGKLNSSAAILDEKISGFSTLGGKLKDIRQHEKDFLLQADVDEALQALKIAAELKTTLVEYGFEEYVALTDSYTQALKEVMASYGDLKEAQSTLEQQIQTVISLASNTERFVADSAMNAARLDAEQAAQTANQMLIAVGLLVLILVTALLSWTGVGAIRNLTRTVEALKNIAAGDLTIRVDKQSDDEFGQLADAVNQMTLDLQGVVGHVTSTSNELSSMSDSLSGAVEKIAGGNQTTSEQTISMAAATEQMNATVSEVSETTAAVNDATKQASLAANAGGEVISRALQTLQQVADVVNQNVGQMQELGRRSQKIDMVIDVIKNVAEQTNLLALNAAIEAARAGEAGRGFAVVADEVRTLAQKTVGATNEITTIVHELQQGTREAITSIESGRDSMQRSTQLGAEAAEAMHGIEGQVESASDRTHQIAVAIEQLASTMRDMAQNMEHISAAVGESSFESAAIVNTSQQVAGRAIDLKQITARFKIQ
ncbi:MAG: methyl-accepting chemotaxis protein [Motiliproteus sp.]|jgi:methyl-accepting chemotaxis protein